MEKNHSKKNKSSKPSDVFTEAQLNEEPLEAKKYRLLVHKIKNAKKQKDEDDAFKEIAKGLEQKIKRLAGKFKIPGLGFDDIYQECLQALRYKAIEDYDATRGSTEGPAFFDRFALLCIRRHLATKLKTAHQNKVRILNESKSLDQERSNDSESLSLMNIVCDKGSHILDRLEIREFIVNFLTKLKVKLSPFETKVFILYVQKYTYEEIAEHVLEEVTDKSVKAIDNGLSRLKNKGWEIYEAMLRSGQTPPITLKWLGKKRVGKRRRKH